MLSAKQTLENRTAAVKILNSWTQKQ